MVHYSSKPELVGSGYKAVKCGGNHSAAISTDSVLFTWGSGPIAQGGQLLSYRPREATFEF